MSLAITSGGEDDWKIEPFGVLVGVLFAALEESLMPQTPSEFSPRTRTSCPIPPICPISLFQSPRCSETLLPCWTFPLWFRSTLLKQKRKHDKTSKQTNNRNSQQTGGRAGSLPQGGGSLFTAEFGVAEELLDDQPQADDQQQHVAHGAQEGGRVRWLLEELAQALLNVVHLIVDAEESENVEELVAVADDVEEARLDALGDLAHVEEGSHHQPEVAAVEVHEERGVLPAQVKEPALQHDGAGHAQRHDEDEGAQRERVRAPVGAALAAGHGAGHRQHKGHGQHERAVGGDEARAVHVPAQALLHVRGHHPGVQQAQAWQQVVVVGHGAPEAVVADGRVVQVEEGGAQAQREAAEHVRRAAHGEGQQHARRVAPQRQQPRMVEGHVAAAQEEEAAELAQEQQQRDEVRPEVERLIGGLQHRGQALLRRARQPPVARQDEALHEVVGHLVPAQQRLGGCRGVPGGQGVGTRGGLRSRRGRARRALCARAPELQIGRGVV